MEAEKDYFYWRNRQGIMERHHVSEWRTFMDEQTYRGRGAGKPTNPARENPGQSVSQAGGEGASKAADRPVRAVEEKGETQEPFSTITTASS